MPIPPIPSSSPPTYDSGCCLVNMIRSIANYCFECLQSFFFPSSPTLPPPPPILVPTEPQIEEPSLIPSNEDESQFLQGPNENSKYPPLPLSPNQLPSPNIASFDNQSTPSNPPPHTPVNPQTPLDRSKHARVAQSFRSSFFQQNPSQKSQAPPQIVSTPAQLERARQHLIDIYTPQIHKAYQKVKPEEELPADKEEIITTLQQHFWEEYKSKQDASSAVHTSFIVYLSQQLMDEPIGGILTRPKRAQTAPPPPVHHEPMTVPSHIKKPCIQPETVNSPYVEDLKILFQRRRQFVGPDDES